MFDNSIDGFQNEKDIVNYLNGKFVKELHPLFYDVIQKLYSNVNRNDKVFSYIDDNMKKFGIIIKINNITRRISVKKGINNSVHLKNISDFISFLINLGIEKDIIILYLKYHYADGTTNGSGLKRMAVKDYKLNHMYEIDKINMAINKPSILNKVIYRFVLQGRNSKIPIDGLIYGTVNDFIFITSYDIIKIIKSKMDNYSTGVHFGCLYCQPQTRNLNRNPRYEKNRYCVQIKWYSIFDDIIEYLNNNQKWIK